MNQKRVVIIGGGFGGLKAAKQFKKSPFQVILIDRMNHHLFQPLLYQVATAALSPADIAVPIREILRHQENTEVMMGEVVKVDLSQKEVHLKDGMVVPYDYLILSPGASHSYFGHDEWERVAPGLKTLSDAVYIREHILMAFEKAERCTDPEEIRRLMRFVIVGGGPTGVELAGAIAEISRQTMFKNFRRIKPEQAEVYLVEGASAILNTYPSSLSLQAKYDLEKLGVIVLLGTPVTEIKEKGVQAGNVFIHAATILWAAGNKAAPFLSTLQMPLDRAGRVLVEPDLSLPGHPEVFVIGDAAHVKGKKGNPLPGIAPVAIQEAEYVGKIIRRQAPFEKRHPFRYWDKGQMATIGKAKAIATIWKLKFSGFFAWFLWSAVHIIYLVNFRSRLGVMIEWMFFYLTGSRNVRLIIQNWKNDGGPFLEP